VSRQDAFPVIGSDGELTGIVLTSQVDDIPEDERVSRRLGQISLALPPAYRVAPSDPAVPLASRTPLGGEIAAVVLDHGRVIGMVTVAGLQQAVLRRQRLTTAGR
jgi:CBS-domain-containing membrane protein